MVRKMRDENKLKILLDCKIDCLAEYITINIDNKNNKMYDKFLKQLCKR